MNIFEQYGIKEVANGTLYSIDLDQYENEVYTPVLYLDTLKVSSVNESSDNTAAKGGLRNPSLITWDYGKEITISLTDALYTPAAQSMTWGGKLKTKMPHFFGTLVFATDGITRRSIGYLKAEFLLDYEKGNTSESQTWTYGGSFYDTTDREFYIDSFKVTKHINNNTKKEEWLFSNIVIDEKEGITGIFTKNTTADLDVKRNPYGLDTAINSVYFLERMEKCIATQTFAIDVEENYRHSTRRFLEKYKECELTVFINPQTMQPYEKTSEDFTKRDGTEITGSFHQVRKGQVYYKWTRTKAKENMKLGSQVVVTAEQFSGVYKFVGETYCRNRITGEDEKFQFEIPLCKLSHNNSFTLEAAGGPTTFDMELRVLRKEDGVMMKLTQYVTEEFKDKCLIGGSTNIVPQDDENRDDLIISPYDVEWRKENASASKINEYGRFISPSKNEFYTDEELTKADSDTTATTNDIKPVHTIVWQGQSRTVKYINNERTNLQIYANDGLTSSEEIWEEHEYPTKDNYTAELD